MLDGLFQARPVNIWGHEMFRKGFVIGDSTLTLDYLHDTLGMDENTRLYPSAPEDLANAKKGHTINVPVFDSDGTIVGFQQIAEGQYPSGDNWRSGMPLTAEVVPSVKGGTYSSAQSVVLTTATQGADIYYTTDGSTPTAKSTKYSAAIAVSATTTLKAIAVKAGYAPGAVMEATYKITPAK